MESQLCDFLRSTLYIFTSLEDFERKRVIEESGGQPERNKVSAGFLTVSDDSCYSALYLHEETRGRPSNDDLNIARQFSSELLHAGLCSSALLHHECESRGMFGKRLSPAVIGTPDFAKLAVLKRFDYLNLSKLPSVIEKLNTSATHETFCENKWKALVAECRADSRFVEIFGHSDRRI